jgi:hypothetical protein
MPLQRCLITLTAALAIGACLTACSPDEDGPDGTSGLYRLASVNDGALPFSGSGLRITRGELLLRSDGSFIEAIDGVGALLEGTYSPAAGEIRFRAANGGAQPTTFSATTHGDSIVFAAAGSLKLVYRQAPMAAAASRGSRYFLTQVNGVGRPLILGDTVIKGTRYVGRVDFDSVTFLDGMFFKQHRRESGTQYFANGDSLVTANDGRSYGSFTTGDATVVMTRYALPLPTQTRVDTLTAGDNAALQRRTRLRVGFLEETYALIR